MTDTVDGLTAKQWKRCYDGMVKERATEVHKKREARRILQERYESQHQAWLEADALAREYAYRLQATLDEIQLAEGRGIEPRRV